MLLRELRSNRFFDVFAYNGASQHWGCFLCNHPDRAQDFVEVSHSVKKKNEDMKLSPFENHHF